MVEIKLNYKIEIVKSPQGNQVVKLTMENIDKETKEFFWQQAVNELEYLEYVFWASNLKYIKELKKLTNNFYKLWIKK